MVGSTADDDGKNGGRRHPVDGQRPSGERRVQNFGTPKRAQEKEKKEEEKRGREERGEGLTESKGSFGSFPSSLSNRFNQENCFNVDEDRNIEVCDGLEKKAPAESDVKRMITVCVVCLET